MKENKIFFYTLGCSKNDVDSYHMKSFMEERGVGVTDNSEDADIVVVNTCGFIHDAKLQSIEAIWEMVDQVENTEKKIIIAGCLSQRYPNELMEEIPRINGILGTGHVADIAAFVDAMDGGKRLIWTDDINAPIQCPSKFSQVSGATAYIKISEGCNNACAYCIIPSLKGHQRSRSIEDIKREVAFMASQGVKEIILIAQNTGDYGVDIYGKRALAELIKSVNEVVGIEWIRLLYIYPDYFDNELIDCFTTVSKLLPYVDIPIQHSHDSILKRMNRNIDRASMVKLINKLKTDVPHMVIRTTLIVGFPGETEETIEDLVNFIEEMQFDKLGVFTYSDEEGTRGYQLMPKYSQETMEAWKSRVMEKQQAISYAKLQHQIGRKLSCLVEEELEDGLYVGRTYMDAPDVDGVVYLSSNGPLHLGQYIDIVIRDADEYDLWGEVIS